MWNKFKISVDNRFHFKCPDNGFFYHNQEALMVIGKKNVPFISEFVDALDDAIAQQKSRKQLSNTQKYWLAFCVMAILKGSGEDR